MNSKHNSKHNNMDEFLLKLADLMEEYNVDLEVEISGGYESYPECICIATNYVGDEKSGKLQDWVEIKVGCSGVDHSDIRDQIGKGKVM